MKRIAAVFVCILVALAIACTIHVTIAYINILHQETASAPASIAFLLIIPYGIAEIIVLTLWLIVVHIVKKDKK